MIEQCRLESNSQILRQPSDGQGPIFFSTRNDDSRSASCDAGLSSDGSIAGAAFGDAGCCGAPADRTLSCVRKTSLDVEERKQTLRKRWAEDVELSTKQAGPWPPQLILLDAEYRRITGLLLQLSFARPSGITPIA
jgi:hypothetical protein